MAARPSRDRARVAPRDGDGRPLLVVVDDAENAHPADLRCLVGHGVLVLASHLPERLELSATRWTSRRCRPARWRRWRAPSSATCGATLAWDESELLAGNPKELARRAQQWALAEFPHRTSTEDPRTVAVDGNRRSIASRGTWSTSTHGSPGATRRGASRADDAGGSLAMEALAGAGHTTSGSGTRRAWSTRRARRSSRPATAVDLGPTPRRAVALRRGHYGACAEEAVFSRTSGEGDRPHRSRGPVVRRRGRDAAPASTDQRG